MRVGYAFFGFLADMKLDEDGAELSTPDGNATYSWSIIWEMQRRGYMTFGMQDDRDYPAWKRNKSSAFASFSQEKRLSAYENVRQTRGATLPELDLLLIEWRFPIPGRNCGEPLGDRSFSYDPFVHQPDLARQYELLKHYKQTKTKIVIWDLDHKLLKEDELQWRPDAILETSSKPLELSMKRTKVEPPTVVEDLLQWPTLPSDCYRKLVYVGSRYERDDVITEWIKPTSDCYPNEVEFWGNWMKTVDECRNLWPNVKFNDRITTRDFRRVYGTAVACPLLAKRSYLESGFITPRPWEALLFGTIPVGFSTMNGVEKYVLEGCVARDPDDLKHVIDWMSFADLNDRDSCRKKNVEQLEFMDVRHFVDVLEKLL